MHKLLMKLTRTYLTRRVRRHPPRLLSDLDLGGVRRVLLISATALGDTLFSTRPGNWRSWPTGPSGPFWPIIPTSPGYSPTPAATGAS
jgi:hypothetical protein